MYLKPYLLYFTDPVVDRLPLTPMAREGSMTKVCPNLDPVRIRAPYVIGLRHVMSNTSVQCYRLILKAVRSSLLMTQKTQGGARVLAVLMKTEVGSIILACMGMFKRHIH